MASNTTNYGLKKPAPEDFYNVADQNSNMDKLDTALASMVPKTQKGAAGGVAELGSDGKVPAAQLPAMNFDPAGSANAVQTNLNAHTCNKGNPHNVTAAQVGSYTKEEDVSAAVKALYGLAASTTPSDALAAIKTLLDGKAKFASGSYVGTGGYGNASPTTIFFPFRPKLLFVFIKGRADGIINNLTGANSIGLAVSYDAVKETFDSVGVGSARMWVSYPEQIYFKEVLDTKFSFYHASGAYYQLNGVDYKYNWIISG